MDYLVVDTSEALKYPWMVWKLTGIKAPEGFSNRLYTVYAIFINLFVTVLFPVTLILNVFYTSGMQEVCENLTITITDIISNLKFLNVFLMRSKLLSIKDIFIKLDDRARNDLDQRKVLQQSVHKAQTTFRLFGILYACGVMSSLCKVLISSKRILLSPAWFPVDWENSDFFYYLVLSYQFPALAMQAVQDVANDTYPPAYLCVLTGHLRALGLRVRKIGYTSNDLQANYVALIACIKDHQNIIELYETIQGIISIACLAQFICSALVQCTVAIYVLFIIGSNNYSALILSGIFFTAVTLEIFVICFFGNSLKEESQNLTDAIYACNWPDQLLKFKKVLLLFIMRSHRHNIIFAGNYIPVDFRTFLLVMKYSYSVFTLLLRFK